MLKNYKKKGRSFHCYCHAYMDNRFNENELKYMCEETIRVVEKMIWEDKDDF